MPYKVRGIPSFWAVVDDTADRYILQDLYDICFRMVESGPTQPGSQPTRLYLPPVTFPGWFLDLPGEGAFIRYCELTAERILLVNFIAYDWDDA